MPNPVFVLVASYPDSIINFRGALIDRLLEYGIEVHVAAPQLLKHLSVRNALVSKGVVCHDVPLSRAGFNPLSDLYALISLTRLFFAVKATHMLSYTIKPVIYGTIAAKLAGVNRRFALITGLGYAFQGGGDRRLIQMLARLLYRLSLRFAHLVFFQNPDDRALFISANLLSPKTRSRVVSGSGIDLGSFRVTPLPAAPRFLLIARLIGDKGIREYIAAASRIKVLHPSATFGLVGWIDNNPDAISQRELDKWIADETVRFYGKLDDVRPAIAESSVYVLPSYREGTPRTVLEAMAMGRAVITTDAPGCRETVIDGENGFLVPIKSVDRLALAMLRFVDEPGLAETMGRRSRQIAEDRFDVHRINAVMLDEMGIA